MSIQDTFAVFQQHPTTNMMAASAVVSHWWLPYLQTSSDIATQLLPIAGLGWLIIQAYFFIKKNRK